MLLLVGMSACKPVEKHYRSAYEQAQRKRQAEEAERRATETGLIGGGVLQEVDGARLEPIEGDTLWVMHRQFASSDSVAPWSVGVARMKMRANALSLTEELGEGRCVKSGEEYYVLTGESPDAAAARGYMRQFEKRHPGFRAIGLPALTLMHNPR